jgi:N-acetylneuraminic acid mutarotase
MRIRLTGVLVAAIVVLSGLVLPRGMPGHAQTGSWLRLAPIPGARTGAAAVTLPDGRVIVFGGTNLAQDMASVEIYDPAANTWSPATPMPLANSFMASATGTDGKIYLIGGWNGQASRNTEL